MVKCAMASVKPTPEGRDRKKSSFELPRADWALIERALNLTGDSFQAFVRRACRQESIRVLRQFEVEREPVVATQLEPVLHGRLSEALRDARFQLKPGALPATERINP